MNFGPLDLKDGRLCGTVMDAIGSRDGKEWLHDSFVLRVYASLFHPSLGPLGPSNLTTYIDYWSQIPFGL
jgi:hypothetical protein